MNYLDYYRKRLGENNLNSQNRIINKTIATFKNFLAKSPNRTILMFEDENFFDGVITREKKSINEKKVTSILLTEIDNKIEIGTNFITEGINNITQHWIVLFDEKIINKSYNKYKIINLNEEINYYDKIGQLKKIYIYQNGSMESDISDFFKSIVTNSFERPNKTIGVICQANKDFYPGMRVFIGDEVWKYVDADKTSVKNVYYCTFEKDFINKELDDLNNKITDSNKKENYQIISNYGDKIKIKITEKDLKFLVFKNGKIINSDVELIDYDDNFITYNKETKEILFKNIGDSSITARDKETGETKVFGLSIVEDYEGSFFFLTINKQFTENTETPFYIKSNIKIKFDYDKNKIEIFEKDNIYYLKTFSNLGETSIIIKNSTTEEEILNTKISINSIWV